MMIGAIQSAGRAGEGYMTTELFAGSTYDPEEDESRLTSQLLSVWNLMKDQQWRTLDEIGTAISSPPASISARLRDLRKPKFGSYVVERRARGVRSAGLFEYRLLPPGSVSSVSGAMVKIAKKGRNPFLAGMMHAAKIVVSEPDLAAARMALKTELLKVAKR